MNGVGRSSRNVLGSIDTHLATARSEHLDETAVFVRSAKLAVNASRMGSAREPDCRRLECIAEQEQQADDLRGKTWFPVRLVTSAACERLGGGYDRRRQAFTRLEVILMIAVVGLLAAVLIPKIETTRQHVRDASCRGNLKLIGDALALYSSENRDALPYAQLHYSNKHQSAWDSLIEPCLARKLQEGDPSASPARPELAKLLLCPDDVIPIAAQAAKYKEVRRTYSMPRHNMYPNNWPPGPENKTGVGLFWSFGAKGENPPPDRVYNFDNPADQVRVTRSMIPDPTATMLLTERAWSNNVAFNSSGAYIARTSEHLDTNVIPRAAFHSGSFNYLMVDGHVETLLPEQTVGPAGKAGSDMKTHMGMWTITQGD